MKETVTNEKSDHAQAYFNFLRTAAWVEKKVKTALKPYGLTHAQLNILASLYHKYPNPMSPNEIKESLVIDSPDVTRLIDRLSKKELVTRSTCLTNRRKVDIIISSQGQKLYRQAHQAAKKSINNYFQEEITSAETKELNRILNKMKG